jgi:hypothetical protein
MVPISVNAGQDLKETKQLKLSELKKFDKRNPEHFNFGTRLNPNLKGRSDNGESDLA